jgi:hypothetical protein
MTNKTNFNSIIVVLLTCANSNRQIALELWLLDIAKMMQDRHKNHLAICALFYYFSPLWFPSV